MTEQGLLQCKYTLKQFVFTACVFVVIDSYDLDNYGKITFHCCQNLLIPCNKNTQNLQVKCSLDINTSMDIKY